MTRQILSDRWTVLVILILSALLAPKASHAAGYIQHNLVSDIPLLADFTDANLVNPWGLTASATSPFWLCDQRTGLSTVYTASATVAPGTISTRVVIVPATTTNLSGGRCTGIVAPSASHVFPISTGVNSSFIFDTEDGSISAWAGGLSDATRAVIKVDNSASGAVYKGLAIATNGSASYLYAANFGNGTIDVYDTNFTKATLPGSFADPSIPAGFAPFNIQNLGGKLYVTYAKQNAAKNADVPGPGNGYVDVFDLNGNLLQSLVAGGKLNSPWGVAIAPSSFGDLKNALLVGNFGDGTINGYDLSTGKLVGTLQDPAGNPIVNTGLWALYFGNGGSGGFSTILYITAGISAGTGIQTHGLLASILPLTPPIINTNGVVNAAGGAASPLAPGSLATIFGENLTENGASCVQPTCNPVFRADKRINSTLAGTQVSVNGIPVPILAATPVQLNVQIPNELSGSTSAGLQVTVDGQPSAPANFSVAPFSPGIFPGAVTHSNGSAVTAANPAAANETLTVYATGLGPGSPAVPTGQLPAATTQTVTAPTVTIDGIQASVPFAGLAPCCVGVDQLNVVVPSNVRKGTLVPLVVSISGQNSNTVVINTSAQ